MFREDADGGSETKLTWAKIRLKIAKKILGDVVKIASAAVTRSETGSKADRGSKAEWKLSS